MGKKANWNLVMSTYVLLVVIMIGLMTVLSACGGDGTLPADTKNKNAAEILSMAAEQQPEDYGGLQAIDQSYLADTSMYDVSQKLEELSGSWIQFTGIVQLCYDYGITEDRLVLTSNETGNELIIDFDRRLEDLANEGCNTYVGYVVQEYNDMFHFYIGGGYGIPSETMIEDN